MRSIFSLGVLAALSITLSCMEVNAQQIELSYGDNNVIDLAPNEANQRVDFFVNNIAGKDYDTMELFVQIGDGGALTGGTDIGPGLSDVELAEPGTIFAGGTIGGTPASSQTPTLWTDNVAGSTVTADGIGGTFIFDSTGFGVGTVIDIKFDGILLNDVEFNTNFRGQANNPEAVTSASSGIIRIVAIPEPSSTVIVLAIAGISGFRRRRVI